MVNFATEMVVNFDRNLRKHLCGRGNGVITPLFPTDWEIIFDGKTVSIDSSFATGILNISHINGLLKYNKISKTMVGN